MNYFDTSDNIRADLLDQEAYDQAKAFIKFYFDKKKNREIADSKKSLSSSQLRRFFYEFRQLEKKVKIDGFEKVKPLIKMVKSKAAYASKKIHPKFKIFLIDNINAVNSEKDFQAFMLHFEAVVGFFYGFEGIKND